MKITTTTTASGYSPHLVRAATILRLGGRGLSLFLQDATAANPCLRYSPPSHLLESPTGDVRTFLRARLGEVPSHVRSLAAILAEHVDDDGLLEWNEEMRTMLSREYGEDDVESAVLALQSLGPAGVGGRNMKECLLLQLSTLPDSEGKIVAGNIVQSRLKWFLRRRFDKLPRRNLAEALTILDSLSMCPGARFSPPSPPPPPDVIFSMEDGLWKAKMAEENVPFVVRGGTSGDYRRARQMVAAIIARRRQVLRLAQLLADRQSGFLSGRGGLLSFSMREAAMSLEVSPAMVSHIAVDKYFSLNGRVYALKSLFALPTPGGTTAAAVREHIHAIIADEDPTSPVSDRTLLRRLRGRGIAIARRTVGKYRAAAGIARASLRKSPPICSQEKSHAN